MTRESKQRFARFRWWAEASLLVAWLGLAYPTFTVWRDSVPWVNFMSWYAIVISHVAGLEATMALRETLKAMANIQQK